MDEYYSSMLCYRIVISYQNMTCVGQQRKTKKARNLLREKQGESQNILIILVRYF